MQCSLQFELQPSLFPTEQSRLALCHLFAYCLGLFVGNSRVGEGLEVCTSFKCVSDEVHQVSFPVFYLICARTVKTLSML